MRSGASSATMRATERVTVFSRVPCGPVAPGSTPPWPASTTTSGRLAFGFEVCARLPEPAAFRHGGALLAKDVRLLREVLGDDPGAAGLAAAAKPFLDQVLGG